MKRTVLIVISAASLFMGCRSVGPTWTWRFESDDSTRLSGASGGPAGGSVEDHWDAHVEGRSGTLRVHWSDGGRRYLICRYRNGEPDGMWQLWHPNGRRKCVGFLDKGDRCGVWTWWGEDGGLVEVEINSPALGTYLEWWPDGMIRSHYALSKPARGRSAFHGPYRKWTKDGSVETDLLYDHGTLITNNMNGATTESPSTSKE